ncbi:MAG: DUF2125 domain-containing protein [Acetobacteraceae bacterium]|nr:DUF2125 domain-containing protein [Acetobacteraceae bacterium]
MDRTRQHKRRRYWVAGTLLLAAVLTDTVAWALACHRLETGIRESSVAAGWTLSAHASHWAGWPTAAAIVLEDATARTDAAILAPLTWTAPRATLSLSAWHPTRLTVSASGAQSLAFAADPPVAFTARSLLALIDLTARDPARITAAALEVAAPSGPITIAAATLLLQPDAFAADLSGLGLTGPAFQPIPPIDAVRLDGQISPPIIPKATASASAQAWRASGGKLQLDLLSLRWGALAATGHATLMLDPALQPAVTGQITATGLATVTDQLAQSGAITRTAATAAQAILAILAAPARGGPVTLPITVQDGTVIVARIPLLRLAPLVWD